MFGILLCSNDIGAKKKGGSRIAAGKGDPAMKSNTLINEQSERMRVVRRLCASIAARPALLIALTLYWTWVNMAFQSPLFFPSVELSSGWLFPSWFGPVAVSAATYLVLGMCFKRVNVMFSRRWYIGAVAACMAAGALLCFVWINVYDATFAAPAAFLLYCIGSFGVGFGTACLLVEWGRVFGYLGPQEVLFHGIIAMLCSALLIAVVQPFPVIGESFQLVGFCYVHLIMWGVCSYLTKSFSLPATWVVAWPTCSLMLGQLVGGSLSATLVQQPDAAFWIQITATVVSFVMLMAALLMLSNRNLTTGWGIARPANAVSPDSAIEQVVQMLTVENSLTPREFDTLELLARGRNRKFISEELVVSEETIKSHVYSIYRKLGIHSQQELLDLIEARVGTVRDDSGGSAFE